MTNESMMGKRRFFLTYFFFRKPDARVFFVTSLSAKRIFVFQCKRNKDFAFRLLSLITIVWIINDWCVNITIKLSFPTCFSNRTACNWCSIIKADICRCNINKHKHQLILWSTRLLMFWIWKHCDDVYIHLNISRQPTLVHSHFIRPCICACKYFYVFVWILYQYHHLYFGDYIFFVFLFTSLYFLCAAVSRKKLVFPSNRDDCDSHAFPTDVFN